MTDPITNNNEYSRIERQRQMVRSMNNEFFGSTQSAVLSGNRYGAAKKAGPQLPQQAQPFGFYKDKPLVGGLKLDGFPIDLQKLTPEQISQFNRLDQAGRVPQNPLQAKLFKLAGVGQEQGASLTGQFADPRVDARTVAINRGVQLQDVTQQVQARLINPQMAEMIRGMWMPNLPQAAYSKEAGGEAFQKWAVEFQNLFSTVDDATKKQGGGLFSGWGGAGAGGGDAGGGEAGQGGGDSSKRSFRWNG